ncbi:MAG TPA: alpha/beta fold hydrolase [Vicinamibacterales bacterium]|nr:alpha/beta fold hydrolase [Vicinamibacterales bacterium]
MHPTRGNQQPAPAGEHRRSIVRLAAVACLVWLLGPAAGASAVESRTVTFRTADGVTLAATLYEPSVRPAPGVVLVHMFTRSRRDWEAVGDGLAEAGFVALAFDLRGHGASGGTVPDGADGQPDFSRLVADVQAACAYLASRPDLVRAGAVGIAGASLGANLAVLAAADDPSVRSLALLSPSLAYRTLRAEPALRKYGDRPALLVAGTDDPYALRSVEALAKAGSGTRRIDRLDGAGHGTIMLGRAPDLIRHLVDWFRETLL